MAALFVATLLGNAIFVTRWLRDALPGKVSRDPRMLSVHYDSVRTLVPGVVEVRGLVIKKQVRRAQWIAELDHAKARVSLVGLWRRRFDFGSITGEGLRVRVRVRADERPEDPRAAAAWDAARAAEPPFEEWSNPPDPRPEIIRPPDPDRKRWRYTFADVDVKDVRELWVGSWRYAGSARLRADLVDVQARNFLELDDVELTMDDGAVTTGGRTIADAVKGTARCSTRRHDLARELIVALLDQVSGGVDLTANLHDLSALNLHLRAMKGVDFSGGEGPLRALVKVEDGRMRPGSRVELDAAALRFDIFSVHVTGDAQLRWSVERDAGDARAAGTLVMPRYVVAHQDADAPHVEGEDLRVSVESRELDLRSPFTDVRIRVAMEDARVADVSAYQRWLPEGAPFRLAGGSASMSADVTLTPDSGSGRIRMRGEDVRVTAEDVELSGRFALDAPLVTASPRDRVFSFAGTKLDITDARVVGKHEQQGWWGHVQLPELTLTDDPSRLVVARVDARLRDSGPIATAWGTQKLLARLMRPALFAENVVAHAGVVVRRRGYRIEDMRVTGTKLLAKACLDVTADGRRGAIYFDAGMLSAGVRFDGGGPRVTPLARAGWWERNADACPGASPSSGAAPVRRAAEPRPTAPAVAAPAPRPRRGNPLGR